MGDDSYHPLDELGLCDAAKAEAQRLGQASANESREIDPLLFAFGLEGNLAWIRHHLNEGMKDSWGYLLSQWAIESVWVANHKGCPFRADVIRELHYAIVDEDNPKVERLILEYEDQVFLTLTWATAWDCERGDGTGAHDDRDSWIYEQVMDQTKTLAEIRFELGKNQEWKPISTDGGIKKAAIRYAMRNNKKRPPSRKIPTE